MRNSLSIILIYGLSVYAMDDSGITLDISQLKLLDIQLINEVKRKNIDGVRDCLVKGAHVNAFENKDSSLVVSLNQSIKEHGHMKLLCDTALHCAVRVQDSSICKLLLEWGADLSIKGSLGDTALAKTIYSGFAVSETLFVESMFVPHYLDNELQNSQQKVFAILCSFKRICPVLPKDIRYKILSSDDVLFHDVCNAPFGMHKNKYDCLYTFSYSITKLLITAQLLDPKKTVSILLKHKIDHLQPLVEDAFEGLVSYEITEEGSEGQPVQIPVPNHDNWIDFYGKAIKKNIRLKLGLHTSE